MYTPVLYTSKGSDLLTLEISFVDGTKYALIAKNQEDAWEQYRALPFSYKNHTIEVSLYKQDGTVVERF